MIWVTWDLTDLEMIQYGTPVFVTLSAILVQPVADRRVYDSSIITSWLFTCFQHLPSLSWISEKDELEKQLSTLQHQLGQKHTELERLQSSSLDMQRQRDLLRQQREDLERQLARECSDAERG